MELSFGPEQEGLLPATQLVLDPYFKYTKWVGVNAHN